MSLVDLLPGVVQVCETRRPLYGPLFPAEENALGVAAAKRCSEFRTVRVCARSALDRLGVAAGPLVPDHRGAPSWPEGVTGSMTHCDGYAAAAVADRDAVAGLGIDAEPHAPLPDGVLDLIASPLEITHLRTLESRAPWLCAGRLLFSAKEAVYKVWYPLTGRWLGFGDVELILGRRGTFAANVWARNPRGRGYDLSRLHGSWAVSDGIVLTAALVEGPALLGGARPATLSSVRRSRRRRIALPGEQAA